VVNSDLRARLIAWFFSVPLRLYCLNNSVRLVRVCLAGFTTGVDTLVVVASSDTLLAVEGVEEDDVAGLEDDEESEEESFFGVDDVGVTDEEF